MLEAPDVKAVVEIYSLEGDYISRNVFRGDQCMASAKALVDQADSVISDGYLFDAMTYSMSGDNITSFVPSDLAETRLAKLPSEGMQFTPSITRFYSVRIDPSLLERMADPLTSALVLRVVEIDDDRESLDITGGEAGSDQLAVD